MQVNVHAPKRRGRPPKQASPLDSGTEVRPSKGSLIPHPFAPEWRMSAAGVALIERWANRLPVGAKVIEFGPGASTAAVYQFKYFGVDEDSAYSLENKDWLEENGLSLDIKSVRRVPEDGWYDVTIFDFPFVAADMIVIDGPKWRFGDRALQMYKQISTSETMWVLDDSQGWESHKLLNIWGGRYGNDTVYDQDKERKYRATTVYYR